MEQPIEHAQIEQSPVVTIPRANFNYLVIAITFFVLGAVIGAVGFDRFSQANREENIDLINRAVDQAITANNAVLSETLASLPAGSVSSAGSVADSNLQELVNQSVAAALEANGIRRQLQPDQRYDVLVGDNNPARGPEDAVVTIIEFSDFRCGYCGRFAAETLQPLLTQYEDRVRFVYRDMIIFGQTSYEAALAAHCANDQGRFWDYHNLLFANQQDLNQEKFVQFATDLGLDVDTFNTCFAEQTHRDNIVADVSYGDELGITGTPAFFINGRFVSGAQPLETFIRIIDEELASAEEAAGA